CCLSYNFQYTFISTYIISAFLRLNQKAFCFLLINFCKISHNGPESLSIDLNAEMIYVDINLYDKQHLNITLITCSTNRFQKRTDIPLNLCSIPKIFSKHSLNKAFQQIYPNFFENNFKMTIISLNSNNWSINWYKWNYWNKWCNISS
ncbi:hypothetical protein BpHYR1_027059, partial [Brachionus plicatilis]